MKYLSVVMLLLGLALCACNNNDEPVSETNLPIVETFIPVSVEFNVNDFDQEQKRQLVHLVNNEHVVNSDSEIPDDPVGLNDAFGVAFGNVDFNENTLLIKYLLNDYSIEAFRYRYYLNNEDNSYNWAVNVGAVSIPGSETSDLTRLTRFAILVKKLPADAKIKSWFGMTKLD